LETQQQLVEAAKRVLPQQKQRQLATALKKTGYGVQRSRRKAREHGITCLNSTPVYQGPSIGWVDQVQVVPAGPAHWGMVLV
jgi:hypothetical protein